MTILLNSTNSNRWTRGHLMLAILVVGCTSLFACGPTPLRTGPDPVPREEWCDVVSARMCSAMTDQCFNGMSEVEDGCLGGDRIENCLAGRSGDEPSGRSYDDLNRCVTLIDSLSCGELGSGTGGMMVGAGPLAEHCQLDR
ncbi:MAG: hypothetical protein AAGF12_17165 [Myxococcota bacterium]